MLVSAQNVCQRASKTCSNWFFASRVDFLPNKICQTNSSNKFEVTTVGSVQNFPLSPKVHKPCKSCNLMPHIAHKISCKDPLRPNGHQCYECDCHCYIQLTTAIGSERSEGQSMRFPIEGCCIKVLAIRRS